jgi:hypothetical protein
MPRETSVDELRDEANASSRLERIRIFAELSAIYALASFFFGMGIQYIQPIPSVAGGNLDTEKFI